MEAGDFLYLPSSGKQKLKEPNRPYDFPFMPLVLPLALHRSPGR